LASSPWSRQHSGMAVSDTFTETTVMHGMRLWVNPADSMRYFFPVWRTHATCYVSHPLIVRFQNPSACLMWDGDGMAWVWKVWGASAVTHDEFGLEQSSCTRENVGISVVNYDTHWWGDKSMVNRWYWYPLASNGYGDLYLYTILVRSL